jgi:hypothetical protein
MATAIDNVLTVQREIAAEVVRRWRDLVVQIANGQEPDPADVSATIEANGKTPADLQADVHAHVRRVDLRKTIEGADTVASERAAIEVKVDVAAELLAVAKRKHDATVFPLASQLEHLEVRERDATAAKAELARGCRNQQIIGRMDDVRIRLAAMENESREVRSQLGSLRSSFCSARDTPSRYSAGESARLATRIEDHESHLIKLRATTAAAVAEMDEIYNEMIQS